MPNLINPRQLDTVPSTELKQIGIFHRQGRLVSRRVVTYKGILDTTRVRECVTWVALLH